MMNNQSTTPALSVNLDLDWADDDAYTEAEVKASAEAWLDRIRLVPTEEVVVEVVTLHGPGGGWPVVRFTAQAEWTTLIEQAYDADAEDEA